MSRVLPKACGSFGTPLSSKEKGDTREVVQGTALSPSILAGESRSGKTLPGAVRIQDGYVSSSRLEPCVCMCLCRQRAGDMQ